MFAGLLITVVAAFDLTRGIAVFRQQNFAAAEREFRSAIATNPKDFSARLYLARTLIELDRIPEALAQVENVLDRATEPNYRFQAGSILRSLAEERFAKLASIAPDSAPVRELEGARYERTGDLAKALEQYRGAAALDPKRPGVHYQIGNILWRMRDLDSAAAELKQELAANPHHGMTNLRFGQILLTRNEHEQAIPYLERSIVSLPESIEARRETGKAYRKVGRTAEARRLWESVAAVRPEDDQVHYLLGNLYREIGEPELAKRELDKHRDILSRRQKAAGNR